MNGAIINETLAEGCICGMCDESCPSAKFRPCCGACMVGSVWDEDGAIFAASIRMSNRLEEEL